MASEYTRGPVWACVGLCMCAQRACRVRVLGLAAHLRVPGANRGIIRARDFEHALEIANDGRYRLTGGVYSRKPAHLLQARQHFRVGNLYLNRNITGAIVGRQPFGGAGMSGVGSKAGGRDYLLQFVEPRVVTENTMRRGFAPGLG